MVADARFVVGEEVRAVVANPTGHTRLPGYLRGRRGHVESVRPAHPVPDETVRAARRGAAAPIYAVAFAMEELWGQDAEPGAELVVELWEPYLQPATAGRFSADDER